MNPKRAKKVVRAARGGLAAPVGRRLTHQGTKLAKGVWYSTAQTLLAAALLCFKFCLSSPVSDCTVKHARS